MLSTAAYNRMIGYESISPTEIIREVITPENLFDPAFTETPLIFFMDFRERYAGLDFDYYREVMTTYEYRAYMDFIGEERFELDFLPSDFEMYYPEDEG
jgi:hypothetical protein